MIHSFQKTLQNSAWQTALFALGFLALGMASALVGYAIGNVPEVGFRHPPIYPLDWMFWAIWFVLFPTMGAACYQLWRSRALPGSNLALRLFLFSFAVNLTWVPVVHLTHSPVAAPAIMDAVTGIASLPATWAIVRANQPAFLWSLPSLVWGIITGILKIWQLLLNRPLFGDGTWHLLQWAIYAGAAGLLVQAWLTARGFSTRGIR